jgi:hypothetical protein
MMMSYKGILVVEITFNEAHIIHLKRLFNHKYKEIITNCISIIFFSF